MDASEFVQAMVFTSALKRGLKIEVVQTLPATGRSDTLYMVPKTTSEAGDVYEEWLYVSNAWEHIGSTTIDLTKYVWAGGANNFTDAEKLQARTNIGAVATAQGVAHAGDFLVVGNDGNVTTQTVNTLAGGNY